MEDKSPSLCRLCNVALDSPSAWREHAKSDWHVYNLRVRVAEPGTVVLPPSTSTRAEKAKSTKSKTSSDDESNDEDKDDDDDDDTELSAEPEFDSQQCLFCGVENSSFDDNLAHMTKAHSFTIPYQEHLTVDFATLVEFLYLVIYGYGECILCAARRSTVEAIQHHMTAKGHCRFDVASDIAEFYKIPDPGYHADEESLRLPSGRLLSHPTRATGPTASRTSRQPAERRLESTALPPLAAETSTSTSAQGSELVPEHSDRSSNPPPASSSSTQLSRLSRSDQQSLAHLPDNEVRALLATNARYIDQSRREETHAKLRLEKARNIILMAHFRQDTSKRFRGPWG